MFVCGFFFGWILGFLGTGFGFLVVFLGRRFFGFIVVEFGLFMAIGFEFARFWRVFRSFLVGCLFNFMGFLGIFRLYLVNFRFLNFYYLDYLDYVNYLDYPNYPNYPNFDDLFMCRTVILLFICLLEFLFNFARFVFRFLIFLHCLFNPSNFSCFRNLFLYLSEIFNFKGYFRFAHFLNFAGNYCFF